MARLPVKSQLIERHLETVQYFKSFPDDAWVPPEVIAILDGVGYHTVWRRARAGTGPRIVKIGGTARVNVGEYRKLNAARLAAAAQPEPLAA